MAMKSSVSQAFMLFRHRIPCENFGSLSAINGTAFGFSSRKSFLFLHEQSGISVVKQGSLLQSFNFSSKGRSKSDPGTSDAFANDKISEKEAALHTALSQIASSFGKETVMWLGRFSGHRCVPVISTGSINLDVALGIGGLPKGRMVEIYGQEASGKTTMALHVIAEAQKIGGYCVFVDAEHALDPSLAEAIGVNTQDLLLAQPDCGEQALSLVDTFIRSGSVDVVVVDSVAALVPQSELDGEIGDARIALQARLMSQALRKLTTPLSRSETLLIFLNQVRSKLSTFGGFGGPTEVTSGGNALKFYASTRLNIRRTGLIKKGDQTIGSQVVVKVVKNKLAPPFKTAEFELEFGRGISREGEVLDLGCKHGFITKSGSHYGLNGEHFHGKDNAKKYLRENGDICDELIAKLKEKMLGFIDGQCNMGTLAQDAIYGQDDKFFSGNNSKEIESMGMTESLG